MSYFVYMLKTLDGFRKKTYVGYTNNLENRLKNHNNNRGAKSTRGYKWKIIFKKRFIKKTNALSYEYKLKKDRNKRLAIIKSLEKKN